MRLVFGAQSTVNDPQLGVLRRRRGRWRGEVGLDHGPATVVMPLSLPGARRGPDPRALLLARRLGAEFDRCRASIEAALDEHRRDAGVPPLIDSVGPKPVGVAVVRLDGRLVLEVAYRVPWDDEHTLGAHFADGVLIELNGSILLP